MRNPVCLAVLLSLGILASAPLRAGWTSLGSMPPGARSDAGVDYRGDQGAVRLSVIEPGVIRVRFTHAQEFAADDSYAVLPSVLHAAPAAFQFSSDGGTDRLRTGELTVEIQRNPFRLRFLDAQGRVLDGDADDMGMAFDAAGRLRVWKDLPADAHLYGFGERSGPLDKRGYKQSGSSLVDWNSDTPGYDRGTDPLYDSIPFFLTLDKGVVHGTFFDNNWRASFDVGRENPKRLSFGADGGELNYYILAGPLPADVLRRYAALTGPMPLPPLWALGYHQCRWSYYPDSRVLEVARGFRERHIPADVIWLDIHHMNGYRVFTWDPRRFPQPQRMIEQLAGINFKVVPIIDPGVKLDPGYAAYDSGLQAGVFAKTPDGKVYSGPVWPGPAVFPDFTDAAARKWWAAQIAGFVSVGLAGIWNDMNEPSVFGTPTATMPDDVVFQHNGRAVTAAEVHNVFGQQMTLATREGLLQAHPDLRPFVLTRATYAGGQRYAAVWAGDNVADWPHLHDGIATLLGMGISGYSFVGNDIGGFADGPVADAELFTRWMEAGAFFPFMRAHTVPEAANKEPWAFGPEHEAYNRRAIERRYEFLPYLYNCFYQTSQTGMPTMRALLLQYPDDPKTWDVADEFLTGGDLLVAPVLAAHARDREVYLPRGAWYDLSTDREQLGGRSIHVHADEDDLPLFAAEGAILFRAPVMQSTADWPTAELTFDIFAHGATERQYYEDDGSSFAYEHGEYFKRTVSVALAADGVHVVLGAAEGSFVPRHRDNAIVLHFAPAPHMVSLNGSALAGDAVHFDAARSTLTVRVPQSSERQTILVHW
ncbi:MAG: TIM-barrel domain-containing protein [Bryobacteraceae bacterium]